VVALLNGTLDTLSRRLLERRWCLATAESCTGGLVAAACTELSGSSAWFERGFVTYSNAAKTELLGVSAALIEAHGAVSEAVARGMAEGALRHSLAQVSVAITGVAGPTGGSADKPVGTVCFAWAVPTGVFSERVHFGGERSDIRRTAVQHALQGLLRRI
jgi:nicotinamide-nucleotide amidase